MPDISGESVRVIKWNVESAHVHAGNGQNPPVPTGYIEFRIPEQFLGAFRDELREVFELVKGDKDA